jgi:hypothetical protein
VIVAAAVCPHPPLLFRELSGQADVAGDLRAACVSAIRAATGEGAEAVAVVGGADRSQAWDPALPAGVRRYGTTGDREEPGLPLSLGVGTRLLRESGWDGPVELLTVRWDAEPDEVAEAASRLAAGPDRIALLVLGDGSCRRGDKAPGYVDERAFPFDEATGRALASGDVRALLDMDSALAEELMVGGRAAFQVLAAAVRRQGGQPRATMLLQQDPFGVMYYVALWRLDPAGATA